jgi:hypothetical protein
MKERKVLSMSNSNMQEEGKLRRSTYSCDCEERAFDPMPLSVPVRQRLRLFQECDRHEGGVIGRR